MLEWYFRADETLSPTPVFQERDNTTIRFRIGEVPQKQQALPWLA